MTRRAKLFNCQGFTLIELLVVITILSVILVSLYTSFRVGLNAYNRTEEYLQDGREAEVFLLQLERELKNAVPYTHRQDAEKVQFIGKKDSVQFPAVLTRYSAKGAEEGICVVEYKIKGRSLTRSERVLKKKSFRDKKGGKPEVLFQKLKSCRFAYLYLTRSGELTWEDEWLNNPYVGLPRGIRVTIAGDVFGKKGQTFEILIPQGILIKRFT